MEGPPHKKPRSSSPSHATCDNDISWVSELNSELPDELSKLETCATTATAASTNTTNVNNNNDPLTTSSSRSKAEETIQKNKNLSQLLSSNEPRSQQIPHGVMPMGMGMMNRGSAGFRQAGMMVPTGGNSMQLMAGRQRAAGFAGQGGPGMHGMMPGVGYVPGAQQQQIPPGMYQMHNNGSNQIMMNSNYPNSGVTIRHPEFMRHKSVPGPNMAASMSGGYFVANDTHRTMNGGMISRSTSVEAPYNNGPFSEGPNLMMSGGAINAIGPLPVNQGPNGFGPSPVVGANPQSNSQIPGNINSSMVNGNAIPPQVDTRQNVSSATSSAVSGNTPSLGLLSPDPSNSATPRSTTANFQQTRTGMLSPETGMFPVSPAIPPEGADQTPNNSSPDERKRDIQNKLRLLLHAHKCQQQPNNGCTVPRCSSMKGLLKHMRECQELKSCQVHQCCAMRQIIQHWRDCQTKGECNLCAPLWKNMRRDGILQSQQQQSTQQQQTQHQFAQQQPQQQVMQPQQSSNPTTTTSSQVGLGEGSLHQQTQPPNSTYNMLVPSTSSSSSPSNHMPTSTGPGQGKMASVTTNAPSTTCSSAPPTVTSQNLLDSQYSSLTPSLCNNISSPLSVPPPSQQPQQNPTLSTSNPAAPTSDMAMTPRPGKEWQLEIQQNLRNHLVQKLVSAIFPMRETNVVDPERMQSLISYSRKLEGDMFDNASSKEEYYHLLAEKIYKIQKELEEKRQRRAMDVNGPNQIHGNHMHMNQGDPQAFDGPGGFGNPQLNSIYLMNHSVGMGQSQQPQPRMGGPPSHHGGQQPGHPSQIMDPFGGEQMMHHHHQHPRAHPHHARMHHQQFMNNPRMGGVDPYPAMSGPRMAQQQGAGLVPYRCTDPTVGQMMYRGSAMPAGSMAGGPGMGIMDGFVNHRAMSSNVRTPFGNEAFIAKHDMMELQRQQQQMQQLDHHHHHHQQGMPSCPPSNSAQHLGASTSMMMGLSHQGVSSSSSASSSSMAATHHPAPPISFTPSPADPGGSASLQPNSHLSSSVDGQQLSPFTRSLMPSTPGVPPSPNPSGFLTPGPLSMPPCSTSACQNSVSSLLSPPSFTNSPAQMGRQQQQQSMHFNNSNATNNGPISNKSPPFEGMSVSTPSGAGHHHLSSGSCLTPVHTPAHKVLRTPNPLMRHEDVTDDEVTVIKPELSSIEEFKYDMKATVHEDITDDEADGHNGVNVNNSVLIHQQGSKMSMDANLMVKQECMMNNSNSTAGGCSNQGLHVRSEIKDDGNLSAVVTMVDYGAGGATKPVIKIEPVPDGVQEGVKREDSLSMVRDSSGKEQQDNNMEKMEAEEPKVSFGSASVANVSNGSDDVALQSMPASGSGDVGDNEDSGKALVESQSVVAGGNKKKVFGQEELYHSLWPVLHKLYQQIPECEPFLQPVDADKLGIPDYHNVIKKPMDMSTVKLRLETGLYKDPWEFIEDVGLMFDNAWLYNRKTSKVYKCCSKLAEVFDNEIDEAVQSLGYCCGRRHVFSPQVLCCFGKQLCSIPRDTVYYNYKDRYIYCEKCFNELQGEEVEMVDDPSQPLKIPKNAFKREKNDKLDHEQFVHCKDCDRKMHKICVLHMEAIWPEGFICNICVKASQSKKKENRYTAKRLPVTKLGTYLETRVNSLLKKRNSSAGEVTIRVLSSSDKMVDVKPLMKARFVSRGDMPDSFPYRVKAMFAFEEIDGIDVCFFGMHVQEYGSGCPLPNTRRVYIAYLDSVHFFQPRENRTPVYHEILIGYLEYAKSQGFETAHIWACPPSEGDDYIFHCHPPDQKIPKPKRLQDWYKKMLDKALHERVIIDYKDIYKDAIEGNITKVTEMPYFEGDFWPNILEECIKDLEHEENEKKKRAEEEAAQDTDDFEGDCNNLAELETFAGKKKGQKSGNTKKKNSKSKKPSNRKKAGLSHCGSDLSAKLLSTMEKHKEGFFVIRLQPSADCTGEIKDPDPLINCDLMDGRDAFLTLARDKHYEFSSLRRAKYSSMGLLYELHVQARDDFIYTCNDCKAKVETRYHCGICDDYDLCVACYKKSDHAHKDRMTKLGLELDPCNNANQAGDGKPDQSGQLNSAMVENRSSQLNYYIQSLEHACSCRDANCRMNSCQRMKGFLEHLRNGCRNSKNNKMCKICLQLKKLCFAHAKQCDRNKCPVPNCSIMKERMEKQRTESKIKNNQLMRRRMAVMQRQPMLDREEQSSQCNQLPSSDPPTPTPHHPGGYGGGGKYLHHLGSPPPNQGGHQHHQAAMMAAHQAEQMAQSQRQMSAGYSGGGPMMMGGGNQMMMGGGVIAGGNVGNPMMAGSAMNPMLAGGSMMAGGGNGPMVGSPAAMMSGGGPMTIQQQRMIMMQQQQHGSNHMMDRGGLQGGMPFMQDEMYRQQQIMAMQHQATAGMDPMLGPAGQGPASNQMAMLLAKKKEAGITKGNSQMMLIKQNRQRQMTPQMMSAGGQMMDAGGMMDEPGMMMSPMGGGSQMMMSEQMMGGHSAGARMLSPQQQQQQQWMMHHHQQQLRQEYPGRPQQFGGMQSGHHPAMMYPGVQSSPRIRGMGFGGGGSMHHSSMMGDGMDPMMPQNYMQQQQQMMMQRRMQMKQASMIGPQGPNGPGAPPNASVQQRLQSAGGGMGYMGSPGMMMEMGGSGAHQQSQVQQPPSQLQPQQMGNPGSTQMQLSSSVPSAILPSANSAIPQQQPRMLSHALSGKRPPSPGRRLPNYSDTMMMQQQQMVSGRGAVMKPVDSYQSPVDPNGQRIRFSNPEYSEPPMYPPPQTPAQPNPNDTLSRFVNNM